MSRLFFLRFGVTRFLFRFGVTRSVLLILSFWCESVLLPSFWCDSVPLSFWCDSVLLILSFWCESVPFFLRFGVSRFFFLRFGMTRFLFRFGVTRSVLLILSFWCESVPFFLRFGVTRNKQTNVSLVLFMCCIVFVVRHFSFLTSSATFCTVYRKAIFAFYHHPATLKKSHQKTVRNRKKKCVCV